MDRSHVTRHFTLLYETIKVTTAKKHDSRRLMDIAVFSSQTLILLLHIKDGKVMYVLYTRRNPDFFF